MLKEILSVSGKPGLFKLISQGSNMFIVESLIDHKRGPVYMRDKVNSLGDVYIYTNEAEVPLGEVFQSIYAKENGKAVALEIKAVSNDELRDYLESVLPTFDKDRVYPSDIRKLLSWYNLLVNSGWTEFVAKEETTTPDSAEEKAEAAPKAEKKAKTTPKAKAPKAPKAASETKAKAKVSSKAKTTTRVKAIKAV